MAKGAGNEATAAEVAADEVLGQRRGGVSTMVGLACDGRWRRLAMVPRAIGTTVARQDRSSTRSGYRASYLGT